MEQYLASSEHIDWKAAAVLDLARELAADDPAQLAVAKRCFQFVRDQIKHSGDFKLDPVTCSASEVLEHGTGYCYAKSHLLAALLRANGIPAGLCYQRLTVGDSPPYCLHGLNAVYLQDFGWYRADARGNKTGVYADFCPPEEKLAFAIATAGEADLPEIWPKPLPLIVNALQGAENQAQLAQNLPDIALISSTDHTAQH